MYIKKKYSLSGKQTHHLGAVIITNYLGRGAIVIKS